MFDDRKETRSDKAERVYRREQKRIRRERDQINRANGYAVSPPRPVRSESMSPPRHPPKPSTGNDPMEEDAGGGSGSGNRGGGGSSSWRRGSGYAWMGGLGRSAREEVERVEEMERMAWMAHEEVHRGNPFGGGGLGGGLGGLGVGWGFAQPTPDTHIPRRYRPLGGGGVPGTGMRRDAVREVELEGGSVPDLGRMNEEEYAEWVRDGMYRLRHRDEVQRLERQKREKEEKERGRQAAKEKARKEEKRRMEMLKREKSHREEEKKRKERERYRARWVSMTLVGGEIEERELAFIDIPWPVYRPVKLDQLDKEHVKTFMLGLAGDTDGAGATSGVGAGAGGVEGEFKKQLREAIRAFHPDRFFGRILPRVRERDQEMVKDGVEICSRVINALAGESR